MRALAFLLGLLVMQASNAAGQQQDTIHFGDRVRIVTPTLRVQTARFLEVDSDSVRLALSRGTEAKVGQAGRLEVARGRNWAKGFGRGALVGALVGAGLTGLASLAFANCGECDSNGGFDVAVAALIVGTPAAAFGVLGLSASPTRWRPAVLPAPALPDAQLPPPDLGTLQVWAVARNQAKASQFATAWQAQRAGGSPLDPAIQVDEAREGSAEVVYTHPDDASEATLLAFWLRRTLKLPTVATRLERHPTGHRILQIWLGS